MISLNFNNFNKFSNFRLLFKLSNDNNGQGSSELLLLLGGLLIIVLILVSIYKSYLLDLTDEMSSNELNSLNSSFSELINKFNNCLIL